MRQYDIENEQAPEQEIPQHYEWYQVFYTLFTQPRGETFQELLKDPQAKAQRAYLWMLLPSVMSGIASQAIAAQILGSDWLAVILMGSIFGGVFGVISFVIGGWVMQRVAVLLGGNQQGYGEFHYARGTFMPVLSVVYMLLLLLPLGNMLPIYLHAAVLTVELLLTGTALRTINQDLPMSQIFVSVGVWYFIIIVFSTIFGGLF